MRKLLAALFFLFFPVVCGAQGQWTTPLPVDLVIPMNTSTPGTTLTNAIANAGMVSNNCVPGGGGSTGCSFAITNTGLKVGANQNACSNLGPVAVNAGGPTYAAQTLNYNNLAMLDSVAFTNPITNINFGSGIRPTNVTMTVCMTLGMPGQANGNDYDTFWLQDGSGHGSIAQIGNGCGGSAGLLGISIEANSPFAHSACIRLFPSQTYWISLNVNGTTACAGGAGSCSTLTVYTPNGTQIGQVNVASSFSGLTNIRIPSNENGTDSGTTHYQNAMVVWTGTVPLSLFWTQADPSAGVLAPTRTGAWTSAGVTGGIPTGRTQCVNTACAAISGSSTAANIQSAFTGAPANTYVLLPAVTYPFCLSLAGASKVTLRGAGANKTIFTPTSSCGGAGISVTNTGGTNEGSPATVSGMTIPGTNVLTLSSVSGLAVGDPIVIDQHDSTTDLGGLLILGTTSAYTGPSSPPGNAGPYSIDGETQNARCPGGQNVPATCFHQEQISVVTNISGNNVTISPALEMPNWLPGNTMSAWWASSPIQYDGIEDLTVNTTGASGSDGIDLTWCANCWTKGVAVINTNLAHVQANYGANDQVENSYFFLTQNHVTSSYGVVCNSASSMLIENNIFHGIASPIIWNGTCNGAVAGYNFNANDYYTASAGFSQNFYGEHSGGVDMSLLEGNITQNWAAADNIHGTGNLSTFFRNVITGTPAECWSSGAAYVSATYVACNNPLVPFQIQSYHRFYSVIGNVLGTTGQNTSYLGNGSFSNADVYSVGLGDSVPNDANVYATMMLWANADSATGYGSPRFNCSEVGGGTAFITFPTSQAFLINPCPASHTIPASFYYSSKPAWWPSGKAWPIIGPDITGGNLLKCTGGTQTRALVTNASQCPSGSTATAFSGLAYSNPAMDCYLSLGGNASGTGGQLTGFNETACYNSVAAPIVSFSPTSVAFGNQTTGTTSAARAITLTNTGNASLLISGITLTGSNPTDFGQTNNCGATVLANASCTINATFTPASAASFSASVSVADNAAGSPQTVALTGTGLTATAGISFSPTSLAFGSQQVSVTSAPLSTTVTNTGSGTLTITAVTITGTNPSDFAQTNTCSSVAPSLTCSISVTFRPGATGARSASVSVTDNAAGSPQSVPLTGTGTAAAVGLSPASLAFGNQTTGTTSAARTTTLTNTGNATLTISSITITGTNAANFAQSNNCGASVAVGGSCLISVTFTPSAAGARSASVSVADNAAGSPQTVPLTGTGVTATSGISFNPTSLAFGSQQAATSSTPINVIVTNTGSATLTFTSITVTGTNAPYFSQANNCLAGVAPAGTCTISVTFTPAIVGSFSANVSVADNVAGSPQTIGLTGTGTAAAVSLSPASLNFSLDSYGGQLGVSCTALGYFHTQKIGNRWYFCDPIGHGFVSMNVGGVTPPANPTLDCAATNVYPIYIAKYGDVTYNWSWQTLNRMVAWGFNSLGQDSGGQLFPEDTCPSCTWPGKVQPVKLPYAIEFKPAENASINAFSLLASPLKDAITATNTNWTGYRGAALYDAFDPALSTEWSGELARNATFSNSVRANDPYILAIYTDDSDYFSGSGAGPDFATGHTTANTAFTILLTSPVQTYIQSTAIGGDKFVYATQQFFSKSQALNPVTTCSITNPCSLRDFLWQKYGTIGALNTSWGSSYTTFDSSGTQVSSETIGTGDGTTTVFTHTLAHTAVSPFSVLVSVAGTAQIGDCPWFHSGCITGTTNLGTLGSPTASYVTQSTSTVNYSTGAVTITFVTAPANGAAITAAYIYGGWMAGGTGLMDENGANAWVGTNPFCLEGASAAYPTYFSCVGGGGVYNAVPNANSNTGADLDAWLPEFSAQYFKTMRTDLRAVSNLPYFGLDILGAYGVPAFSKVLQGAAPYLDGAFTTTLSQTWSNTNAEWLNRFQYMTQYLGDIPFMTFNVFTAQADSSMSCYAGGTLPQINFSTQALRGQNWLSMIGAELGTTSFSGSYPVVGADWWTFVDFQQLNQGLTTIHDNAYDATEPVVPPVTCDAYYASASTCGGESATYNAPYGDAISSITAGNALTIGTSGQPVGTPSAPKTVTLTNTGSALLTISSITVTGADSGDFGQTNNCGASVAVGGSCTINVIFTPSAAGNRSASLSVADNASGSPQLVPMTGIGYTPTAGIIINPASLTFATQTVGTPSNAQAIIVTNTGTAAITFSSISLTGADAGDYGQTNTCGASLAVNASCSILVTFMPTTSGTRTASVSIADNVAGSPQTVALSGTGITGPLVAPDPGMFSMLQ